MDRARRPSSERQLSQTHHHPAPPPPPTSYLQNFPPPTAQPPVQIPFSDPFQTTRDPFLPGSHTRRGSFGLPARAWLPPTQGNGVNGHPPQRTPPQQQSQPLPPPPPPPSVSGLAQMPLPYDPSRRRSLGGGAGSPPQYHAQGPLDPPPPPPSFQSRQMPPPSPPQMPSSASSLPGSAPRGPPTASPFAGVRDLASFSSHRPAGGMSISSILGGGDERKPHGSPHAHASIASTPKPMQPPSPGRARASSMREGLTRGVRDLSPPRNIFREPRAASAALGHHDRTPSEPRRDGMFGSPLLHRDLTHSFRAFHPPPQEPRLGLNGHGPPGRPSSQPTEQAAPHNVEDIIRRDAPPEGRFGTFRHYMEPHAPLPRSDLTPRHDAAPFQNGHGPTSQPSERAMFSSPQMDRDIRQPGPMRFQPGTFGTPMHEDQAGLFRPAYQLGPEPTRESIESRPFHDLRREIPRSSPPLSDLASFERGRNGFIDRPMTLEEHQRLEATHRQELQRKESDGSGHRSLLNVSPDLNRKGRSSPLPQAVQGAQPKHVGPGGDNPGIKMEFGRMFSGLGSGVGTATPTASRSVNGTATPPPHMSPARYLEGGDLVRTAVAEIEEGRGGGKVGGRGGGGGGGRRKSGRRERDDEERTNGNGNGNGRDTPEPLQQRGNKRAKTTHHHHHVQPHHHHHHHHHQEAAGVVDNNGPSPFNMLRFSSNGPLSHQSLITNPSHHHHHHHSGVVGAQAAHHHHHPPRSSAPALLPRKTTTTVMSRRLIEECAGKPRKHLGSQLYTTELSILASHTSGDDGGKAKFSSKMKPIPVFEGKENCTYTVRVPRWHLAFGGGGGSGSSSKKPGGGSSSSSSLEEICKRRQVWGSDVYTDDSDVLAAAVHSGWILGDFGERVNADLRALALLPNDGLEEERDDDGGGGGGDDNEGEAEGEELPADNHNSSSTTTILAIRPRKPVKAPPDLDAHITLLILPPLDLYASTTQHHMKSRSWGGSGSGSAEHDGMSFMVLRVAFLDDGGGGGMERGGKARKARLRAEESVRRLAAADGLVGLGRGRGVNGGGGEETGLGVGETGLGFGL